MRRWAPVSCVLVLWGAMGMGLAQAADPAPKPAAADPPAAATLPADPPLPPAIVDLIQDRNYDAAFTALERAAAEPKAPRDQLTYFQGRVLFLAGKYDQAIETLAAVERDFPKSPWAPRARMARAVALARKGDYRAAEQIYREAAERLLSEDRKQHLADIYLEFADALFDPADEHVPPDYAKARQFYLEALEVEPSATTRPRIELRVGICSQELREWGEALARFARFVAEHPQHELTVEARYRWGECLLAAGQPVEARRVWEDLLAKHAGDKSDRLPEAAFRLAETFLAGGPPQAAAADRVVGAYAAFLKQYPAHRLAPRAHVQLARFQANIGRLVDAEHTLTAYLAEARFAEAEETPLARQLLGDVQTLGRKFDAALATYREFLAAYPTHAAWSEVQARIVTTEFAAGYDAFARKDDAAARRAWDGFLARYPLDPRQPRILLFYGAMEHRAERWEAAIAAWRRVVAKYPQSPEASEAQYQLALVLEQRLDRLPEALAEFRKLTWGPYAAPAAERVAELTRKQLAIATERVFRGGETPAIRLDSRNLDKVQVRVYRVDLETYFRKMHLATGVEGLDIALIDPDAEFEFAVPKYAEYRPCQSSIPVPLPAAEGAKQPGAGVLAVTVSSRTLEATTLVLVSDLDILVKSSRDEVFVFAENMRTGRPWAGARILVSDGQKVLAEAVTDADGIFRAAPEGLHSAGELRVLAVADGHVASNVVDLSGVNVAQGLEPRGWLDTDRPLYQAGEAVHVRGVIRLVDGDRYVVEEGKSYDMQALDARGRVVFESPVKLGKFGSFHTRFALPEASPPGDYRLLVRDADGRTFTGSFQVASYQLEPVRLTVEFERRVVYRGETVRGTIAARYYYGAPLVDREVQYQTPDGRNHVARTNAAGEVRFEFDTREFAESQPLPVTATLPDRQLAASRSVQLAVEGFGIALATRRDTFLADEPFELTLTTIDAEAKPLAAKLTLRVLEQTEVDGRRGERLVSTHEAETAAADGTARLTLKIPAGGQFTLRASGTDRFGQPVTAERIVTVSDDRDRVRLRILAERHTYRVGDTADVRLHWREGPALALVTFDGARILGYRLVELKPGDNRLRLPITADLAPNFELSVAVMTDARPPADAAEAAQFSRFHVASTPLTVERELRVAVVWRGSPKAAGPGGAAGPRAPAPLRPGDSVEALVTVTDPQGRPVEAELSLALVDAALEQLAAAPRATVREFFRGPTRVAALRTSSSATFAYRPATRPIDAALLAESERAEIAAEEAARLDELERLAGGRGGGATMTVDSVNVYAFGGLMLEQDVPEVLSLTQAGAAGTGDANRPRVVVGAPLSESSPAVGYNGRALGLSDGPAGKPAEEKQLRSELEATALPELRGLNRQSDVGGKSAEAQLDRYLAAGEVYYIDREGVQRRAEFDTRLKKEQVGRLLGELADAGATFLPPDAGSETAYWNPSLVTDADGRASVSFVLPERSTTWNWHARGITVDTLPGQADGELTVRKELFGELKLPLAFVDGDRARVVATIHRAAEVREPVEVTLRVRRGEQVEQQRQTLPAAAGTGPATVEFPVELRLPAAAAGDEAGGPSGAVEFELVVESGPRQDTVRRTVPIEPFGAPVFAASSGAATGDMTTWVTLPEGLEVLRPRLEITVGPDVERTLLDAVLAAPLWCELTQRHVASGADRSTSDLLAALGAARLLGATRHAGGPEARQLDSRIRAAVGELVAAQADDGGWSWTGRAAGSERLTSARVVWALALARQAGYPLPDATLDQGRAYLTAQLAAVAETDYDTRVVLLHALQVAGIDQFTQANRLFRNRQSLSPHAVAWLALALATSDHAPMAVELLGLLANRPLDALDGPAAPGVAGAAPAALSWGAPVETAAVYLLALLEARPADPRVAELAEWLLARRSGRRWSPEKATGPAVLALSEWRARHPVRRERYELTVFVNDREAGRLAIDDQSGTQSLAVPPALLKPGAKQRVLFQMRGRGQYTFHCLWGGFVPAERLKSTTDDWHVRRYYEPAPREFHGRELPRGFGIVEGNYRTFRNPLTQLAAGARGRVELQCWRQNDGRFRDEQLDYLVVTEPLPSGVAVVEASIRGGFERYELGPGQISFFLGNRRGFETISFEVAGYLPGTYRAGPTLVRSAYRPERLAVSEPTPLAVLPEGAAGEDVYRLTPDELLALGQQHFARREFAEAARYLSQLLAEWRIRPQPYGEAVGMLLDAHLVLGPPREIVRYFELVKERTPEREIPFADILRVGAAYDALGEYERSYLVYRATVESRFFRELSVSGFLEEQGEFVRGVAVMHDLLTSYPPEPYLAANEYALAQRVYAYAPRAAADARLRKQGLGRVSLIHAAAARLDAFLTSYPDDPAADEAAFALANAWRELEQFQRMITAARRYAERYPESNYVDSYWYLVGYGHFALGEHDQALAMCRKVAETTRTDPRTGRVQESPNKWQAIYILGQVFHSLGRAQEAIDEYARVAARFPDAAEAIAYFRRRAVELDEVTTIRPGEPARFELRWRNVTACDLRVYRIDLMKLGLLKRDLTGITQVNLAGIRPQHEATLELLEAEDFRDHRRQIDLPLKEEGAYLVVVRGGDLHASGLVLVSPLELDVQEDPASGRVRATVKEAGLDRFLPRVELRVIGSRNPEFVAGQTDLRGVFVADAIQGRATVLARADGDRYAFFRGSSDLMPAPAAPEAAPAAKGQAATEAPTQAGDVLQEQLQMFNDRNLMEQEEVLRKNRSDKRRGVQAGSAY